ncbi:uncharacterized protein PAC_16733 [Phialocephala subalpina]|uniref:Uncharacterized protein n=1 Tax=Phialocephala subalpina TaxID=576137 RepID=A0A1L7XP94_9HELO|nr:uncharacterized protein PAC_16733 [Phialocephala subalpina]
MGAKWCDNEPTMSITLYFKSTNIMDINALLNPKTEEETQDVKMENNLATATRSYDLPIHPRATPVEVGGYDHHYPTPANSSSHQYSKIVPKVSNQPPCGPLPPMNLSYEDCPSPALSHAEYHPCQSITQMTIQVTQSESLNKCASTIYHGPRQLQVQQSQRRPSYLPTASHVQARQCPPHQRDHRSSRLERDHLHQRASTPTSPISTSSPCHLQATYQTVVSPPKKRKTCSNEAYRREQVHWMRYMKIDMNIKWGAIEAEFPIKFNQERDPSSGGLSSRYYRDNSLPCIDGDGNLMYDSSGKPLIMTMKVRSKDNAECGEAPWTFVERHPWMALEYEWVSIEHKKMAVKIVADIEKTDPSQYTRKQQFAVAIREFERIKDASKQTRRNGSLSNASTYSGDDQDLLDAVAEPTAEEILQMEEDEREMDKLYKEAAEQKFLA